MTSAAVSAVCFPVWGGTAVVVVTGSGGAARAEELLREELAGFDRACSRFRADSEIRGLVSRAGAAVRVSPLLADALDAAWRAAELTDGLVDPTVGRALVNLGYDRDFAALPSDGPDLTPSPAPGWWRLGWDSSTRTLVLPRGIELDLGATAKALAADRAVTRIATELGGGVLVNLAGDVAVAGPPPVGGWLIAIGDDHRDPGPVRDEPDRDHAGPDDTATVAITAGGLATSGTTRRRWRTGGVFRHHIVDPRTGGCAPEVWRTVSVAAASCVDANTASTAAIVLGADAPRWLASRGLPARLVAADGGVRAVAGWPVEVGTVAA
jgi:thiamine biosynthesis lipoprotein